MSNLDRVYFEDNIVDRVERLADRVEALERGDATLRLLVETLGLRELTAPEIADMVARSRTGYATLGYDVENHNVVIVEGDGAVRVLVSFEE